MSTTDLSRPSSLADIVRDRVRSSILDAIPASEVDALVEAEWKAFFVKTSAGYGAPAESPFQRLVRAQIESQLREGVKDAVSKSIDENMHWNNETQRMALVGEIVDRLKPIVLDAILNEFASGIAQKIRQGM